MSIEPKINVSFDVVAYDCSGYGDDRSTSFNNVNDAVEYARSLEERFFPSVWKRISMDRISIKIDHTIQEKIDD